MVKYKPYLFRRVVAADIKDEKFTADVLLNLLSRPRMTIFICGIFRTGRFYISDNAYEDLDISRLIEQDVVTSWSGIMVRGDLGTVA